VTTSTKPRILSPSQVKRLEQLMADAERFPRSYSRERIMQEADEILDSEVSKTCVVCDGRGCEFCPKA